MASFFDHHANELQSLQSIGDNTDYRKQAASRNAEILLHNPTLIPERLTQHDSVFAEKDIARELNKYIDDPHEFQAVLHAVLSDKELVRLQPIDSASQQSIDSDAYFSTRTMINIEREMMDSTKALYQDQPHGVHSDFINDAIADQNNELQEKFGGVLSDEQINAIKHMTGSEGFATLIGYAGAGKSTALKAARRAWEAQGYKVHGAALAGKAAAGLQESSGIQSRTLHSYQYLWENKQERHHLTSNDVFVIDAASMVGSKQLQYFLSKIEQAGAKIVLVGDSSQLQPIAAGGAFKAIEDITSSAKITEIRRQTQDWQRQVSMDFANGNIETALKAYENKGYINKATSTDEAIELLVDDYMADLKGNSSVK